MEGLQDFRLGGINLKRNLLIIAAIVFLAGLALYGNQSETGKEQLDRKPEAGFPAPLFALEGMDGKTYDLAEQKKPVVINFWASWCGPCRLEAPILTELHEKYGNDIEIWGINLASNDQPEKAKEFAEHYGFQFPVPLDKTGSVASLYQVVAIPSTFFLDRHQNVVKVATGLHSKEEIEELVQQLIAIP